MTRLDSRSSLPPARLFAEAIESGGIVQAMRVEQAQAVSNARLKKNGDLGRKGRGVGGTPETGAWWSCALSTSNSGHGIITRRERTLRAV